MHRWVKFGDLRVRVDDISAYHLDNFGRVTLCLRGQTPHVTFTLDRAHLAVLDDIMGVKPEASE